MEVFDIRVHLRFNYEKLFVVPFEIQSAESTIGYLLVRNKESLGSIFLSSNNQWTSRERLPWDAEDLQLIGKEIESVYFSFLDFT